MSPNKNNRMLLTRGPSRRGSGLAVGETCELDGGSLTIDSRADNLNYCTKIINNLFYMIHKQNSI